MEDDKIRILFSRFEPELSSDFMFMNKLRQNLNAVEIVRQQNRELRSRNKKAVVIAATVGFIVGFMFSLSLPYINDFVSRLQLSMPDTSPISSLSDYLIVLAWMIIGATSVFAALNTYEISITLLTPSEKIPFSADTGTRTRK